MKARRYSKAGIGADDYIIFVALVSSLQPLLDTEETDLPQIALYGSTAFVIFAAVVGGLGDSERNIFTHSTEAASFAKVLYQIQLREPLILMNPISLCGQGQLSRRQL